MKTRISLPFFALLILALYAADLPTACATSRAAPVLLNYQGQLTSAAGVALQGTYSMTFSAFTQETGGTASWQESFSGVNAVTTESDGTFSVKLNSTGGATGNLPLLLQNNSQIWLEIQIGSETLAPRQRVTSAAYALSSPWSGLTGIPAGFQDGTDDVGTAGAGLQQSGNQFSIQPSFHLPQDASNGQVAKWNQTLSLWEASDDMAETYSAGDGLALTGSVFSITFAGNGSAATASRSDHTHQGQSWTGAADTGLAVTTTKASASATGIKGKATGNAAVTGVMGEASSTVNDATGVYGLASGTSGKTAGVYGKTESGTSGARGIEGHAAATSGETYGVYGKSDSVTGYGVYSDGDAKVDGDLYLTGSLNQPPQTGYVLVPAAAFHTENHEIVYQNDGNAIERFNGDVFADPSKDFIAGVNLPHGATITAVSLFFYTSWPLGTTFLGTYFGLYRTPFDKTEQTLCFTSNIDYGVTFPGESTVEFELTSIQNPVVDNHNNAYYVRCNTYLSSHIFCVLITYTK